MIRIVAKNELRRYRRTPFVWVAAAALQLVLGWLFLSATEQYTLLQNTASHSPASGLTSYLVVHFIAPASILMMLATPLLCMNLIALERQTGRYSLFASAPVRVSSIVLGKFLAAVCVQLAILAVCALLVSSLFWFIDLDPGHLYSAFLGLALFVAFATATTLLFSSMTNLPALAGFLGFTTLVLLWMLAATADHGVLAQISPSTRMNSFMQGMLDIGDLFYFLCATSLLLLLCGWRLDSLTHQAGANQ